MTVAELIKALQELPQDKNVAVRLHRDDKYTCLGRDYDVAPCLTKDGVVLL